MIQARIRKGSLDIELHASAGVTVLFGPKDSGKSLVLETIAGFARPDKGRILINDQILFDAGSGINLSRNARRCGFMFHDPALFPHMTLRENLVFAAACRRLPRLERHRRVKEILERFDLTGAAGRRPSEFSLDLTLRCSVARALIGQPRLLLLDEPSLNLDASLRSILHELLRRVRAEFEIPLLLATRDVEECLELGEEMFVLHQGRIVQSGLPREVIEEPATVEVARMVGSFNLLPAQITALDPGKKTSRLRLEQVELSGPYFPGKMRGDQVTLCVRPEELVAIPGNGKPGLNQFPAQLLRVTEGPQTVRLHFKGGISADVPRAKYEIQKHHREWLVEFPSDSLRAL